MGWCGVGFGGVVRKYGYTLRNNEFGLSIENKCHFSGFLANLLIIPQNEITIDKPTLAVVFFNQMAVSSILVLLKNFGELRQVFKCHFLWTCISDMHVQYLVTCCFVFCGLIIINHWTILTVLIGCQHMVTHIPCNIEHE